MSFALDLSNRLTSHQAFYEIYNSLQRAAAVKTLSQTMTDLEPTLADDEVFKMLYCAGVFSQTESAKYRHLAQSIALSTLLLEHGEDARSRSLRLLSDLGNFPAVAYAVGHGGAEPGGNFLTVNAGVKLGHVAAQNWATLGLCGTRVMCGGQSCALPI